MNMTLRSMLAAALGAACLAVLVPSALASTTYYAAPTGSGSECSEAHPCQLKEAQEKVTTEGDRVVVEPGTYSLASELAFRSIDVGGQPGKPVPVIQTNGHAVRAGVEAKPAFHDLRIEGGGSFIPREGSGERVFVSYTGSQEACDLLNGGLFRDVVCWAHGDPSGIGNALEFTASSESLAVTLRSVTAIDDNAAGDALHVRTTGINGPKAVVQGTNVIIHSRAPHADIELERGGGPPSPLIEVKLDHSNFDTVIGEGTLATVTKPGTNGNQTGEPLFVDAASGNFAEAAGSPTIDAGIDDPLDGATALAGEARTLPGCLGGTPVTDIGAYEFVPTAVCPTPASFKFGKLKLNEKKGTASLELKAPGAGAFVLSGKGVKKVTRTVKAAASPKLTVSAIGKWKKTLQRTGGLKVKVKVKFEPNGNTPLTKEKKLTLRKTTG